MRLLSRNKKTCYYALFKASSAVLDDKGRLTGSYRNEYEKPVQARFNISAAKGESTLRQFGEDVAYDKTICVEKSVPVDEYTVWWIDKTPLLDKTGNLILDEDGMPQTPWDYITRKVARSLNSTVIAVTKVLHNG